jgi:hypothetical protein
LPSQLARGVRDSPRRFRDLAESDVRVLSLAERRITGGQEEPDRSAVPVAGAKDRRRPDHRGQPFRIAGEPAGTGGREALDLDLRCIFRSKASLSHVNLELSDGREDQLATGAVLRDETWIVPSSDNCTSPWRSCL